MIVEVPSMHMAVAKHLQGLDSGRTQHEGGKCILLVLCSIFWARRSAHIDALTLYSCESKKCVLRDDLSGIRAEL